MVTHKNKTTTPSLQSAYEDVRSEYQAAARIAQRGIESIQMIAVSKTFTIQEIRPLLTLGHRAFGENKIQETLNKWPQLKAEFPDTQLHLIGPLQSNKAAEAVAHFDIIHTVDRQKIAKALSEEMQRQQRFLPCFIQVNIGNEPQKSGVSINELDALLHYCVQECGLNIIGLMCIPPAHKNPSPYFALCQKLARHHGLLQLSQGMSTDFPQAIAFGATHIRIGRALFGNRSTDSTTT